VHLSSTCVHAVVCVRSVASFCAAVVVLVLAICFCVQDLLGLKVDEDLDVLLTCELVPWRRVFGNRQSRPRVSLKDVKDCLKTVAPNFADSSLKRTADRPNAPVILGDWAICGSPCRDWSKKNMTNRKGYANAISEKKGKSAETFFDMVGALAKHRTLVTTEENVSNLICFF